MTVHRSRTRYEPEHTGKCCDCKGCTKEGLYKAPKDRTLKNFFWFCLEHVQEYNKNWDFYAGMSPDQIEEQIRLDIVGHRPTWNVHSLYANKMKDPLDILGLSRGRNQKHAHTDNDTDDFISKDAHIHTPFLVSEEKIKAIHTLELTPPISLESIKRNYKKLAFKYHPDRNEGAKEAEEKFKVLTDAYHLLVKAFRQSDD